MGSMRLHKGAKCTQGGGWSRYLQGPWGSFWSPANLIKGTFGDLNSGAEFAPLRRALLGALRVRPGPPEVLQSM